MRMRLTGVTVTLLLAALVLSGCGSESVRRAGESAPVMVPPAAPQPVQGPSEPTPGQDGFPNPATIPRDVLQTPDAVPKAEPRSASGNPDSYVVFGKTYRVLDHARGFYQVGYASWYGKKFQGKPTASGEPYDMFKMTAAHKTLPIPSYAKVTNLANGKSVIVRINDRGPFHHGRIIDLSYAAAARLGMLGKGSTKVSLQALVPDTTPPTAAADAGAPLATAYHPAGATAPLYLQAGVFADPVNAVALRERLRAHGVQSLHLQRGQRDDRAITRVLIGPFADETARQAMRSKLQTWQIASQPFAP